MMKIRRENGHFSPAIKDQSYGADIHFKAMMTSLLYVLGAIFGLGGILLTVGVMRAPIGHEDENGFHYETEPVKVDDVATHSVVYRRLAQR
jgi:hypothetical protein